LEKKTKVKYFEDVQNIQKESTIILCSPVKGVTYNEQNIQ